MIRAAIVGASGYTGAELMRILTSHPEISVTVVTAHRYEGEQVSSLYPSLRGFYDGRFTGYDPVALENDCDVVFVGLPHGESMRHVPELIAVGKKVVDLSADFRLADPALYERWYGTAHACPELLAEAVYGLPEINRVPISKARLVANPGCYPTAAIIALRPLCGRVAAVGTVVVDAKSGVSGAGRSPTLDTHFPQAADSMAPYSVAGHRHLPEMETWLGAIAPAGCPPVVFTPHLAPMNRGIICTAYVPLTTGAPTIVEAGIDHIRGCYEEAYAGERFVRLLSGGEYPRTKDVQGSNNCHVALELAGDGAVLVVMSAIDNLVKGASGQAVQNMNIMCGLPEETGLVCPGLFP